METKMKSLQEKLINNLKGYSFEELKGMLDSQSQPEVREAIMEAMERYYEEKYIEWMEEY